MVSKVPSVARSTEKPRKRGLSVTDGDWYPFAAFVKSLDVYKGSQRIHVTNSDAAVAAIKLFESLGIDKARKLVLEKLHDDAWWAELGDTLEQFRLPGQ